jgi:hypothetical protein
LGPGGFQYRQLGIRGGDEDDIRPQPVGVVVRFTAAVVTLPGGDNGVPPPVGVRDAKAMWHLAVPGIVLFLW